GAAPASVLTLLLLCVLAAGCALIVLLRVSWYLEDTRMKTMTLSPWVGRGTAFADTVIEEPADV
ncbi:MAG: hypothetical protein RI544_04325, partial [Haloquadratum sp.]|nr:hypothetical protein [Haloquadratum sp.]